MEMDNHWSPVKKARARDFEIRLKLDAAKSAKAAIGDTAGLEKRALKDDEREQFFKVMPTQIKALEKELMKNSAAILAAEEQEQADMNDTPAGNNADMNASQQAAARAGIRVGSVSSLGQSRQARVSGANYASMFPTLATDMGGWGSGGEYLQVIGKGLHDSRLRAETQVGDTASLGGYAIPSQLWGQMLDSALEDEIVRPRATVYPMTTRELDIPSWDDADRSGGLVGNVELRFEGEAETATVQVAKLRSLKLKARRGAIFGEASNELVRDAASFESNLTALLSKALSFGLDNKFLFGTGAGEPMGALVAPATITIARTMANEILYDDVLNMFSRLTPSSVSRSVWVAAPSTIPQLATMSVPVGTGGTAIPVMTSADGSFTVLTRPVIFSEKARSLGSKSDISLCDFSSYAIGMRHDATLDKSQHVGFMKNLETYRLQVRVDGQPTLSSVVTPLNGDSLSPFITLDA